MIAEEKNGLLIYRFENLARFSEIRHGVFSRKGGHSGGPFASLNVSHGVGDDAGDVEKNRAAVSGALKGASLAWLRQVHSDTVRVVGDGEDPGRFERRQTAPEGDALVTGMPGRARWSGSLRRR